MAAGFALDTQAFPLTTHPHPTMTPTALLCRLPTAVIGLILLTQCKPGTPPGGAGAGASPAAAPAPAPAPPPAPAKPADPATESADIKVRVLRVKNPEAQSIDTSSGASRSSLSPKEGARLVYVTFGITPKQATQLPPQGNSAPPQNAGKTKAAVPADGPSPDGNKEASLARGMAGMVLRAGDWLFASPFARLRPDGEAGWSDASAVIKGMTQHVSGNGQTGPGGFQGLDDVEVPLREGTVISMRSLAVDKESIITLGFFLSKSATKATLRIDGCADLSLSLADWSSTDAPPLMHQW